MLYYFVIILTSLFVLVGCSLTDADLAVPIITNQTSTDITPYPDTAWFDAIDVMSGICFESAYDARNQIFVLRNTNELTNFFNLADNSQLCSRPVERHFFDYSQGHILAGMWNYGAGCTAGHEVLDIERDDNAKTLNLRVRFFTEGDCPYELVRPFWIGLKDASDYEVNITLAQP